MYNIHFAISAALLFITMAVLMFMTGGDWTRITLIWSLYIGGFAQFIAQDDSVAAKATGLILSYFSIILSFAAIIIYTVGLMH